MTFGLNPHPVSGDRAAVIEKLRNKGVSVHVFGVGWPEHPDNHPFISGPDLIKEINKARVVLDISSPLASFPRRIFEGACCGTTVLTQYREEIPMFFDPDEILTYTNYDNLIDKTIEYLRDYEMKYEIGLRGMRRCIYEHNVTQRIEKVLLMIGQRMSWRT
jgi:spore maturation protein CgeB